MGLAFLVGMQRAVRHQVLTRMVSCRTLLPWRARPARPARPGKSSRSTTATPSGASTGRSCSHTGRASGAGAAWASSPEPAEHLGQGCCSIGADLDGEDEARRVSAPGGHPEPELFEHHADAARAAACSPTRPDQHPDRRRRLHLPQPARVRGRRRLRPAPRRAGRRRVTDRLEAVGVLAAARQGRLGAGRRRTPRSPPSGAGPGGTGATRARRWRGAAPRANGPTWATGPSSSRWATNSRRSPDRSVYVELRRRLSAPEVSAADRRPPPAG